MSTVVSIFEKFDSRCLAMALLIAWQGFDILMSETNENGTSNWWSSLSAQPNRNSMASVPSRPDFDNQAPFRKLSQTDSANSLGLMSSSMMRTEQYPDPSMSFHNLR